MWRLGRESHELERLVRDTPQDEIDQREVLERLGAMEQAAAALGPGGWPSNHPRIGENVARPREEIRLARTAAGREPPSYFLAGSVSGACLHCHRLRR